MLFISFIISVVISLKKNDHVLTDSLIHFQRSFALARLRSGMRSPSTSLRFTPWQVPVVPVFQRSISISGKEIPEGNEDSNGRIIRNGAGSYEYDIGMDIWIWLLHMDYYIWILGYDAPWCWNIMFLYVLMGYDMIWCSMVLEYLRQHVFPPQKLPNCRWTYQMERVGYDKTEMVRVFSA